MPSLGQILIIGPNDESTSSLTGLLTDNGYIVKWTSGGEDTLGVIEGSEFNLIMLDAGFRDIDPFSLYEELKESKQSRYIPVIFMTALNDAETRVRSIELGDDFVTRPFESREVLARVERQVTVSKVRTALRESEAKFRSVMESAIDAIISSDADGNIRAWNSAATALFHYTEEEVIGRPIELIIPERFRKRHSEGLNRVSSGGQSRVIGKTVELAALRKNGTEFPVELSLATWFLDDQRYFTGIIRDISERKQAEQKFRSVTESAIDAIISADHSGHIVSWNNAATSILGYTADEAIGQKLELIIPSRFHQPHRDGMSRVTGGGESRVIGKTVELFACTKSGEEVPIELSLSTWTVREARYYTGIIRDIRERKEAEEALRLSEQALRESSMELKKKNRTLEETLKQLQETQHQLIFQEKMASLGKLSAGMAHELNNPASAAQRSAARLQTVFVKWQEALWRLNELNLDQEKLDKIKALDHLAAQRVKQSVELDALTRSDRESEIENWLQQEGIDKPWELASSLVNLGYDTEKLNGLSGDFTPEQLSAVINWLGNLFAIYGLLSEISLGTGRIAEIIKALKSYTYMDQAPVQTVDVHEGLDNTLVILHSKLKDGVTISRDYDKQLPLIQAHGSELNQVWTNLIDNAIDAMDGKGHLKLRTRRENSFIVVEVEDTGPGIPEDAQGKVFDPFYTTKPPGKGTGLGLNISRNIIVQKHHGLINLTSQPGRTVFSVLLPVDLVDDGPANNQ
jgi:PAS domain S-box-containing protein